MPSGLIALLDDVATIAKIAAASVDDVGFAVGKAGTKAAGVVIDDTAVTPRYVTGFSPERELPIIGKIALGSIKNKLFILLPVAMLLVAFAPSFVTPLLMIGGAYLVYEATEKIIEKLTGDHHAVEELLEADTPQQLEERQVAGAIRTDFILSAEIMAITLATLPDTSFWLQAVILATVGIGITALVYGAVALIVKADDAGVALAADDRPASRLLGLLRPMSPSGAPSGADRLLRPVTQGFGRGLVYGMPFFLKALSVVGTAAMIWVGGGIIVHGLEEYGFSALAHAVEAAAEAAGHALPPIAAAAEWTVGALGFGILGLAVGAALIPFVQHIAAPAWKRLRGVSRAEARHTS